MAEKTLPTGSTTNPVTPKPTTPDPTPTPTTTPELTTNITTTQSDSVLELYSAYFNRAADATGLSFWKKSFVTFFDNAPSTLTNSEKESFALQKIAENISSSTEYTELYPPSQSNTEFVSAIYTNLLNRDSDLDGLNFWAGHIDKGNMTKEQAITQMIAGAKINTTAQGIKDAALITNKNAVSKYFAETLKSDDVILAGKAFNGVTNDSETVTTSNAALGKGEAPQPSILTIKDPKVEETKVEETKVEETKVEETKVEETKVEETKVDKTKVEEAKIEKAKIEEAKIEEAKVEETIITIPVIVDDYAANIGTTGVIAVGSSVQGKIETVKDEDWFKVNLTTNTNYSIVATGINGDTPHLILYDKNGDYVMDDYQNGGDENALIKFTLLSESGEYYLGFRDLMEASTGDYTIGVTGSATDPLRAILIETDIFI